MQLRDYQEQAIADLEKRFGQGDTRVPQVLATGLGKTQIFTSYADRWLAENPGRRVLIIAHTDELITQAAGRARQVAPRRRIGIVKAQQNETLAEIIVSSRQTLASAKRREQLRHVGLIIIDEAHHAIKTNTYGKILEHFGAFDELQQCPVCEGKKASDDGQECPACKGVGLDVRATVLVAGFTATLARSDKQKLSTVWQDCTFTRDILFGIRHGYLLDVRGERITVPDLDLSRVRVSGGDYRESDLGEELERTFAPEVIAKEYDRLACHIDAGLPGGPRYRRGLAFWPLVETAFHGAEAFNAEGIRSAAVHGGTPKPERRELLQRFHLPLEHPEAIDVMHNAMVLTEGFDEPTADVVVIARPTRSAPLYQQMVGRALRPDLTIPPAERQKALILDVTGAGAHGLRSLVDLSPERELSADVANEHPELSLEELAELQAELDAELDAQRAGATFEFEGAEDYRGPATTEEFDPLGRDKVWGRTPDGTFYISAGNAYVFLIESNRVPGQEDADPNLYDVVLCSPAAYTRDGVAPWAKATEHVQLPLSMALNWGEETAIAVGGQGTATLTKRKASWRKGPPTEAQKNFATRLGISLTRPLTNADMGRVEPDDAGQVPKSKGELSEEIDAVNAARRIDPLVRKVTGS